jgi:CTP:molybdopterin cytidylyltransferase MocA
MPKIMVTQYKQIQEKALEYGFETVMNEEPDLGISHSIHLGLHKALEMEPDLDGVLFSVCDQPYLEKNTLERLLETYSHSEKAMASVSYEEKLGNPCIIGSQYFKDLFELEGDVGGKKIICRYPEEVEPVTVDNEKELLDIDTKDDSWL